MNVNLIYLLIGVVYALYYTWDLEKFFEENNEAKTYSRMVSDGWIWGVKFAVFAVAIIIWPFLLLRKIYYMITEVSK